MGPQGIRLKPQFILQIIEFYHQFWLKNLSSLKTDRFYDLLTPQLQNILVDYLYQAPVFEQFGTFFQNTPETFRRNLAMNMEYCEFKKLALRLFISLVVLT